MAEGGVKGFAVELGAMLVAFAPVIAVGAAAVGWLALFSRSVSAGVDTDAMVSSLGLTTKEIEKLKNTSVSTGDVVRSEEHTSELQSLMRISYAVFCLKKKTNHNHPLRLRQRLTIQHTHKQP